MHFNELDQDELLESSPDLNSYQNLRTLMKEGVGKLMITRTDIEATVTPILG